MIRRPPRSTRTDTLIPSTTLFRSLIVGLAGPIRLSLGDPAENHRAVRTRRQGKRLHSPASGPWPVWKAFYVAVLSDRSEEHTSELQSLMRISYAVFCWKKKAKTHVHDCDNYILVQVRLLPEK